LYMVLLHPVSAKQGGRSQGIPGQIRPTTAGQIQPGEKAERTTQNTCWRRINVALPTPHP
jgi:hypothetical protein